MLRLPRGLFTRAQRSFGNMSRVGIHVRCYCSCNCSLCTRAVTFLIFISCATLSFSNSKRCASTLHPLPHFHDKIIYYGAYISAWWRVRQKQGSILVGPATGFLGGDTQTCSHILPFKNVLNSWLKRSAAWKLRVWIKAGNIACFSTRVSSLDRPGSSRPPASREVVHA